ncbi:hypothetical protein AcW1_008987 [Taiwanofungus camphoratus]|nr:hypothetical protein AcW1_008987 [Antrodia cinnamomea]
MSLPLLVNGTDCGPVNPLQGLAKRFDQDRGIQQDHFGPGRAGSSRESFRSQSSAVPNVSWDAARFFASNHPSPSVAAGLSTFDLAALHSSLPTSPQSPALSPARQTSLASTSWAVDFLQQPSRQSPISQLSPGLMNQGLDSQVGQEQNAPAQPQRITNEFPPGAGFTPWSPAPVGYSMNHSDPMGVQYFGIPAQSQGSVPQVDSRQWDQEFKSQEGSLSSNVALTLQQPVQAEPQASAPSEVQDSDELARTAGRLMETVRNEQNPKFKNSEFLGLMRQLRDGEVVVEDNQMIPKEQATSSSVDVKGKGRAMDASMRPIAPEIPQRSGVRVTGVGMQREPLETTDVDLANQGYGENPIDAYLRQENEDYIESMHQAQLHEGTVNEAPLGSYADWGVLQRDWDAFEATETGMRPITHYRFQEHNPYVLGEASRTRHHLMHDVRHSLFENVLELEAAVQRDPTNALRWFELGVKQQENERERKAVQALRRALELDPSHLPSWLALAVSHTNEGNRLGAYTAIREWVDRNERYHATVEQFRALNVETPEMTRAERFESLTQCLISMARANMSGEIDADIQIALAVLLNTNEEYAKARDCFLTALAVRPDDWLLFNRVGATLANSGQPEEALQYYYRALELNPAYIRARFNLGISCINLRVCLPLIRIGFTHCLFAVSGMRRLRSTFLMLLYFRMVIVFMIETAVGTSVALPHPHSGRA